MLLSLIKILLFVAIVGGLVFGLELLLNSGESLRIAVADLEFTLGPIQTVVAALLLLLTVWIVLKLAGLLIAVLRFIAGDETAVTRFFTRSRERRGFKSLAEAFTALAAGEGAEAVSKANKAERLLRRPDLTNLIRAQAAEMTGDAAQARSAYKKLLDDERTRFVAVRGLMKQKLAEGDTDTALKLAEKAFVLKPRNSETSDTLLQLQAQHQNWKGARRTLGAKLKYGDIPRDLHKRRDAVLALADAEARYAAGDDAQARDEAVEAARLSPELVPAATMAARAYIAMDKPKNAARAIKTAWAKQPHPDLAAAFAEIAPEETPEARIKRFGELFKLKPGHPETRLLQAELEIAAEHFPAARKALGDLVETRPDARALTLMAAIERGEGSDDSTVKAWLARALTAPRGPQWICDKCGHVHAVWSALCDNCEAFDTLSWKDAPASDVMQGTSAAMLPLIVGALEDKADAAQDEDTDVIDHAAAAGVADAAPPRQAAN